MATKKQININGTLTDVWEVESSAQQIDDTVANAANKNGDTLHGSLYIEKDGSSYYGMKNSARGRDAYFELSNDDTLIITQRKTGDSSNRVALWVGTEAKSVDDLVRLNHRVNSSSGNTFKMLHTGNRPTGSYTGNGSTSARTVNIGGSSHAGSAVAISTGGSVGAIVFYSGAILMNTADGTLTVLSSDKASFRNGVLTISSNLLNYNGSTYYYHVL